MTKVIITTVDELHNLIQSSVRKAFSEQANQNLVQDQDRYLTVTEAAAFLNLAKQTLYQFTSNRSIPFIKKGKKLYFSSESLKQYLLAGEKKSKQQLTEEYNGKERPNG